MLSEGSKCARLTGRRDPGETSSSCDALPGDNSKPESREQAEEEGGLLTTTLAVHSGMFLLSGIKTEAVIVSISH